MKDWKTTLAGFVPAILLSLNALLEAYANGHFDGLTGKQLLVAVALFLIGYFASDKKKSENRLIGGRPDDRK
jgi:hypothetical protein